MELKIGNRIAQLRAERNMTQSDLAEILGVTDRAISKWETGISYPDIEFIPVIADTFNVTTDYLLRGTSRTVQKVGLYYLGDYNKQINEIHLNEGWKVVQMNPVGAGEGVLGIGVLLEKEIYD